VIFKTLKAQRIHADVLGLFLWALGFQYSSMSRRHAGWNAEIGTLPSSLEPMPLLMTPCICGWHATCLSPMEIALQRVKEPLANA